MELQEIRPLISVIVPVYNVEQYILRCMESILLQTYQNYEIIVVDDGSPDDSILLVSQIARNDSRIRILRHGKNRGLMQARRTGYLSAQGDYVVFVDSDDFLPNNSLEILLKNIQQSKSDIASGGYQIVFNNTFGDIISPKSIGNYSPKDVLLKLLRFEIQHSIWGKIFKRTLFDVSIPVIEHQTLAEDVILFYTLLTKSKKICYFDNVVYYYYQNEKSSTKSRLDMSKFESFIKAFNFRYELINSIGDNEITTEYFRFSLRLISQYIKINMPNILLYKIDFAKQNFNYTNLKGIYGRWKAVLLVLMFKNQFLRNLVFKINKKVN